MPKVSVVVPVHNAGSHLRECLDTILNQSLNDIEVLCVDDGSTDGSLEVLRQYAQLDGRLAVITQAKGGAGAARNTGLAAARGEYLSFVDADDSFEPTMLEEMYGRCIEHDADIAVCRARYFKTATGELVPADGLLRVDLLPESLPFSYRDMPDDILVFAANATWNKMFKATFLRSRRLRFQEISRANDLLFTKLALVMADRITIVDKELVNYRVGNETNLQANNDENPLEFYQSIEALKRGLMESGAFVEVERSFVNLALSMCLYNLHSLRSTDSFETLYRRLRDEYFPQIGVDGRPPEYFFVERQYEQYLKIQKMPPEAYLLDELRFYRAELQAVRSRLRQRSAQLASARRRLRKTRASRSYRIGLLITAVPRKVRRLVSPPRKAG